MFDFFFFSSVDMNRYYIVVFDTFIGNVKTEDCIFPLTNSIEI